MAKFIRNIDTDLLADDNAAIRFGKKASNLKFKDGKEVLNSPQKSFKVKGWGKKG